MNLSARLLLAFGLVAVASTGSAGLLVREAWRTSEARRFEEQVEGTRAGIALEMAAEQAAVRDLLRPLCEHDAFVDKALVDLQAGRLDSGRRLALAQLVPDEMAALRLDELVLLTGQGQVLGAGHDPSLVGTRQPAMAEALVADGPTFASFRPPATKDGKAIPAAMVGGCVRSSGRTRVGLVGARHLGHLLDRMSKAYGVRVALAGSPEAVVAPHETSTRVTVDSDTKLELVVAKSRRPLDEAFARLDQVLVATGGASLAAALVIAVVLARSLASPLAQLAREVREVVDGEPRHVTPRGTPEMRQLADAFNRTLHDLAMMRRRHAAMERIAAWREVARRVAHEIKNPLTPIRSSIETLRRLRARDDPKLGEFLDEASVGMLDAVHRIATIASDFARFAKLPAPTPAPVDVVEVARSVVSLHAHQGVELELHDKPCPTIQADRDQLAQMLTNLVQNGMDAARQASGPPRVQVMVEPLGHEQVRLQVRDNGEGVPETMLGHLFEPYVTTKPHGTGLGLPIVQRIVVEHGGEISYQKADDAGACFVVVLPVSGPPIATDQTPSQA